MAEVNRTTRDGLICTLVFAACFWAAWPIAEMGFLDDWSYVKSAQIFARTGHFVYNGWATAMLGWQIPWGALFIHLFGFSFTAVKLSTLPIALATLFLFHAIQIRFGLTPRNSVIGTLTLGLSPLFIPLAATYMTDVPGLFAVLLCLFCCERAVKAPTGAVTIAWLCLAAGSNVAGGTVRQIAWLGALVMVPSTGWLLRNRRGVLIASVMLWIASIACVLYCMHWYGKQPYSVPETIFHAFPYGPTVFVVLTVLAPVKLCGELLCLFLLVFPVLFPWLPNIRTIRYRYLAGVALILLACMLLEPLVNMTLIWPPDLIFKEFATEKHAVANWRLDLHAFIVPTPVRFMISLLVLFSVLGCVVSIRTKPGNRNNSPSNISGKEIFWLFAPFTTSYLLLILPRCWWSAPLDRYVLELMPFAIIFLIWLYQQRVAIDLPRSSILTLALYAVLAIAGTHDLFAWQRARLDAINEVRASGVPRTKIQGGFDYDGWTQIENGGHINDERIQVPPNAYQPNPQLPRVADDCEVVIAPQTPAVYPKYTAVFGPKKCLVPSAYPSVHYRAWLPPFYGTIYIHEIPELQGK